MSNRSVSHFIARGFATAVVLVCLGGGSALAADPDVDALKTRDFGLGVLVGDPTGVTGKLWLDPASALDFGFGFSSSDVTLLYGDYLFHFPGAFGHDTAFGSRLIPYVGGGIVLAFSGDRHRGEDRRFYGTSGDSFGFGVRIPFGLEWFAPHPRLGVFVELVPGVAFAPSSGGFFEGGAGIRYYF
ncbi:MAG: hypothetical protein JST04_16360 [Bdellovibrionales bacterium]|nr:hypothetical protein [Bdellovibrionales bacterium]